MLEVPGMVFCPIKKGEKILEQGEAVASIYYLTKGTCYRVGLNDKGDEIIFGVKQTDTLARSLVGVMSVYGGGASANSFVAQTDCEGYYIPKEAFLAYAKSNPELLDELLHMAAKEHYELYLNFQFRQEGRIANRLCQMLLEQASCTADGQWLIDRPVTNVRLGQFLGIHAVTVAKIMKQLKAENIIRRTAQGTLITDRSGLEAYAQGKKMVYQEQTGHKK